MLPTLALVKLGKTVDYVVGFADLGSSDDFPTAALAARWPPRARAQGMLRPTRAHGSRPVRRRQVTRNGAGGTGLFGGASTLEKRYIHHGTRSMTGGMTCGRARLAAAGLLTEASGEYGGAGRRPGGGAPAAQRTVRHGGRRADSDEDSDFE